MNQSVGEVGVLLSANTVGHYHSGISIHVLSNLVFSVSQVCLHEQFAKGKSIFNGMSLCLHVSSPCQLAVDIFPFLFTPELGNMT